MTEHRPDAGDESDVASTGDTETGDSGDPTDVSDAIDPATPDRGRYGSDGRCRPHGNPWRCPQCLADVSDVSVFNN